MRAPQTEVTTVVPRRAPLTDSDTVPLYAAPAKSKRSKNAAHLLEDEEQEDYLDADKL